MRKLAQALQRRAAAGPQHVGTTAACPGLWSCAVEPPRDPLALAQLLLGLIDDGRRTATYKLAVLLALIDCCALNTDAHGRAPEQVSTHTLARRVVELYWPQVRPYPALAAGPGVLRQTSQPRALTVDAVLELRLLADSAGASTPASAEQAVPTAYAAAVRAVELNLVRMPLGRLQRPSGFSEAAGNPYPRFLYDDSEFHDRATSRQLQEHPLAVRLEPGVGDWLVSLAGLLRPLLELHWARDIARYNRASLPEDRLRDFLFGADRVGLARMRPGLLEAQAGRCFYCNGPLRAGSIDVDHFVPWSRVPNDGLQNLVLTDRTCNSSKNDHFAGVTLLERWATRPTGVLRELSSDMSWPLQREESHRIARGLYTRLPDGTPLWDSPGVFTVADRSRLRDALQLLDLP